MPVELDKLEEWTVGQRMLEGMLAGASAHDCMKAEIARGLLPPQELARRPLAQIRDVVEKLVAEAQTLSDGVPESLDVNLKLPDGRTLAGTVTGVCGATVRTVSYSRVRPRERLRAWVRLLALIGSRPDQPRDAVIIGRDRPGAWNAEVTVARIPPLGEDAETRRRAALEQLATVIDLYDRGMREPLPLACDTSAAYAEHGETAAGRAWTSTFEWDKEDRDPEHVLVYGGQIGFEQLLANPLFGDCAHRLWDGLLAVEQLTDR
jgi:exodeoxyribonuclease V gamma subunit